MTWNVGDQVRHTTQSAWGRGVVVAVEGVGKLRVHFEYVGLKLLMDGMVAPRLAADADDIVSIPSKPKAPAPKKLNRSKPSKTLQEYRSVFLQRYPKGFADPHYVLQERLYKEAASSKLCSGLETANFDRLMRAHAYDEVTAVARTALNATNLVSQFELIKLGAGLKRPDGTKGFSVALYGLLQGQGPFQQRFEGFCQCLDGLGVGKWPVATYFAYMKWPLEHCLLKPSPTKRIADACGFNLNYRVDPNWLTYQELLKFAGVLRDELADLGPKDMIDIQSFIWLAAHDAK